MIRRHHVELVSKTGLVWGWHCLTCNTLQEGVGSVQAAEDAAGQHEKETEYEDGQP